MKKLLIVAAVAAVAFSSCGVGGGSIKTDLDSLAYAIGVDLGTQIKSIDSTMNPNIVAKGLIDVFKNNNKMKQDSAGRIIQEYMMIKFPAKKQKEEVAYLESVEKGNPNIIKTESGLMYEVIMPGDETIKAVNDADVVKVNYVGRFKEPSMTRTRKVRCSTRMKVSNSRSTALSGDGPRVLNLSARAVRYVCGSRRRSHTARRVRLSAAAPSAPPNRCTSRSRYSM